MFVVLLWFLLVGVTFETDPLETKYYKPGGLSLFGVNVCGRRSVNTESYTTAQTTKYTKNSETDCGLFGWFTCDVERTYTKTIYLIKTREFQVLSLYCCDGWYKRSVSGRSVCYPYCRLGCKNGGTCLGADKCQCPTGWIGELCDIDINECHKNKGGCQQICTNTPGSFACGCSRGYVENKLDTRRCDDYNECDKLPCTCGSQDCGAICTNTIGSFKCSCKKGYTKVGSTRCQDIDECLSSTTNNCHLKCINLPGTYGCDCRRGFHQEKNGTTCTDINECANSNGGCEHKCQNSYGSYVCRCRFGFKQHRHRMRCVDIDECKLFHGCENQCVNTLGSFFCSCPRGYALNADKLTCNDVDECSLRKVKGLAGNLSLSDCEQQCINTVGSFKCSCKRGFLLRSDGKTCKDADECTSGKHRCDHKCTNTFGSYVCSCMPGYKLTTDKKTCRTLPCESIESPFHGSIKCDGARTGATCLFTCDPGYQLLGSSRRYCLPSSKWNDTKTTCKAKSCPDIQVPENTAVLLPCYKTFRSKCTLQCSEGYYSKIDDDSSATCDVDNSGALEWNLNNFKCEKLQICQPNPCQNDGKCLIQGRQHTCDCKGTGFEGSECKTGIITTPVFDKLKANEQSRTFYLHAQPKNDLIVTIKSSQSLIIKPKRELHISKSTKKVAFSIVPMKAGFHVISYSIRGQDAKIYKVPDNSTVYVKPKEGAQSVYKQLQISEKTLPVGCHSYTLTNNLFKCQVNLTSSHPWVSKSSGYPTSSTAGIVHINTKYASIPISFFGTSDGTLTPTTEELLNMIHKVSSKSMNSSISISKNGKCEVRSLTSENLLEFIQIDAFPNTMLASLSSFMPKWIQFNTDKNNDLFDISNLVVSAGKPPSYGPGSCENLPPTSSLNSVFYKPSVAFEAHLDSETKKFGSNEPACFGIDVCKNRAFVDLSLNARKSFLQIPTVQSMKSAGWDFDVSSFGLGKEEPGDKDSFDLWMKGDSKVYLKNSHLSIGLNLTGETTTRSECFDELFTRQFTCPIYGNIKGKISMRTTLQLENSKKTSLNFKSDKTTGKFLFGGKDERITSNRLLPDRCGSSQGAHITLKAKENPFQGSLLSHYILPYLQQAINVSIYNTIEGGGRTGVKVPPDMRMKLMFLGFLVKPFQTTIQGAIGAVPQLDSEISNLVKMVSKLDALKNKASQLLNTKVFQGETAENFKTTVFSIESTVSNIVKLSTTLSSKLSRHKSNFKIMSLIAGAQSFEQNIKTVPLKLDTNRSPVKQDLKGILVGTVAQVCLGQLCIPDVKVMVDSPGNARKTRCDTGTDVNNQPFLKITAFPSKNTRLGKILSVQENKPMEIRLASRSLKFDGIFNIFGMSNEAQVKITDKQLYAWIKGHLFGKFKCKVHLTADSNVDDWRSLVFKAKGTMDKKSSLTKMLEERLNNYALNLVGKSEKRVEKAKTAYENATLKLQSAQQLLKLTLDVLKELKKNGSILQKRFTNKQVYYKRELFQYNSESGNKKTCELTECNRICSKTYVQDICWDKVNLQYTTSDCKYMDTNIKKFLPSTNTIEHEYTTTPSITKDLSKCKMGITSFFESALTFGLYNGKRRKRSIRRNENESVDMQKKTIDINEYLRARNSTLELNFDINIELRKRIPKLPRTFDFNRVLNSYILKQYNFNVNKILREKFPALPSNFDIDKELLVAVPALKTNFVFDEFLREIVLQAAGHKKNVNFKKELGKLSPQLANDFDKVLKRSLPELQALNSITELIQKYLDSILISSFDQKKFDKFDINSVFMSIFRGFPNGFNINKLLQNQIPQLAANFDINKLIKNSILGIGPNVQQLDELIAKTAGIPGFSLQVTLSRVFPGFDKRFNLEELIKTEMNNMISVKANRTKLNTLTFNKIIQNVLPKFQHRDIDNILTKAFPGLEAKFNFREILKGAIPLMKIIGDVDLNQLVKSLFPSTALLNLDLDKFLKRRNPALRGEVNIERFLSKRLQKVALPSFNIIFKKAYQGSPRMPSNLENLIEDIIGMDGIEDLRNLVYYSVFPDSKGETTRIFYNNMDGEQGGRPRRRKRSLGRTVAKIVVTTGRVLFHPVNVVGSVIDAIQNSGCTKLLHTTLGTRETHKYTEILTTLTSQNVPIKKWTCENSRDVTMTSEGYKPRTCYRKDIPCVKFLNPVCLKKNIDCFKQRETSIYNMSQSASNATLFDPLKKLVSTEKEVYKVAMRLEESRLRKQLGLQNKQIAKARVSQLRAMESTSRIIYEQIKRIPQVDLGFKVKRIVKESFADRPLRVTDLSFSTVSSTLSKSRLPFQATIKTKSGKDLVLDFIIDFENINSSLSYAREEAIRQYTSPSKRKRRSLDDLKSVIPQDDNLDSCLFANNASLYFSDILNSLRLVVESYDEQNVKMRDEINALDDAVFSMEKNSTNDADESETKDYIHVLSIYRNKRQEQTEMASWNDTLVTWKNFVENVTEMRQLPNCSGSIDCIEELNEKLSQHYLSLGNKSDVLNMVTMIEELTSGIKELLEDDVPEESVKLELQRLSILLNKTKDNDFLCGNKPSMLTNDSKEVRLLNGESITLHCHASSQTEITYFWRRSEFLIQTSKEGALVLRNIQDTDQGLYRCEARNLKGIVFSGISTIVIEAKPLILEHPEAVQVPLNRDYAISFSCVATGKPKPTVTWLYRPPSSNFSVVLQNENSNILSITPDNVDKSGYYYCEALNTRGLVVSRKARLDVMRVEKANPKIAILFNATKQCKKEVCRKNQNIPSRLDATLRNSILSMISKPMRVSFKDIKRLRYWQISEVSAQIAMYVSSPTVKNTDKFLSNNQMMEQFSEARMLLVGRLKRLSQAMNKTVLVGDNSSAALAGEVDTLGFSYVEPDCPPGQWIHSDGYYCVECPPGSHKEGYEGRCQKCPVGTYQPRSGQTDCTPCGVHQTTLRQGSIDVSNCIKKAICPSGSFASKIEKCEKCPPNTYQPLSGQKSCLPCSTGSVLEEGQSTCKKDPGAPENFIVVVLSSTSVELHWLRPTHTAVSYYELEYGYPGSSVIRTIKVQPIRDTDSLIIYRLRDLEKYTKYSVNVYAVLGKQRGKPATLSFRTQEDVPEKSPTIITAVPLNTTAVEVTWKELPMHARNGIILSYTVYVKENAFQYYTKHNESQTRSTIVTGLNRHTIYCIRITASTAKGPSLNWKRSKCTWVKTKNIIT